MAIEDVVAQAEQSTGPVTTPLATPTEPQDPDDAELDEARKAVAAEGTGEAPPTTPAPATPAPKPGEPSAAAPQRDDPPVMIPKARFDEVNSELGTSRDRIARLEGENAALRMTRESHAPTQDQPAPKTAAERLTEIHTRQDELAKRFDDGEINLATWTKENRTLQDAEAAIREEALADRFKPQPHNGPVPDDMRLQELTAKLEEDHPYTLEIPAEDPRWRFLHEEALRNLREEGHQIPAGEMNPADRLIVRTRMAELTDYYGPRWTGKALDKKGDVAPAKPNGQQPTGGTGGQMSPSAQARGRALERAAAEPPDVNRMGSPGTTDGDVTEAQLETMSDEEIAALPKSVRDRFSPLRG